MFDFGVINFQFEMCETKCQIKESCHCFFFQWFLPPAYYYRNGLQNDIKLSKSQHCQLIKNNVPAFYSCLVVCFDSSVSSVASFVFVFSIIVHTSIFLNSSYCFFKCRPWFIFFYVGHTVWIPSLKCLASKLTWHVAEFPAMSEYSSIANYYNNALDIDAVYNLKLRKT
jgi:hypothetical protein